jgi:hypothetical protein
MTNIATLSIPLTSFLGSSGVFTSDDVSGFVLVFFAREKASD